MVKKILPNLLDFTLEEMEEFISSLGKEKFRARQIMKWLHQSGSVSFEDMTTLSRDFRAKLSEIARISRPQIVKILTSTDGTKKALLRLDDGLFIESVLIPGKSHWTICISTQAGCAMDCKFCLTASQGFKRNTAGLMQPFHDLPRAEFLLSQRGNKFFHLLQRKIQ